MLKFLLLIKLNYRNLDKLGIGVLYLDRDLYGNL